MSSERMHGYTHCLSSVYAATQPVTKRSLPETWGSLVIHPQVLLILFLQQFLNSFLLLPNFTKIPLDRVPNPLPVLL